MLRPLYCLSALWLALSAGLAQAADCPPLLKHRFTTLQGQPLDLCAQQDKVILVVNTASKCVSPASLSRWRRCRGAGAIRVCW
jgi:glutathione peroxidase